MAGNIAMGGTQKLTGLAAGTTNGDSVRYEQLLAWALDSAVVHNTGTENVAGAKTFTTQLIGKGTTTNDSAAAGYIGEYIESVIDTAQNFPTSTQYGDLTSISLTAGDWDVTETFRASLNSATCTDVSCGISVTSGNSTTGLVAGSNLFLMAPPSSAYGSNMGFTYRVSLASTTTVYFKIMASYSLGNPQARGRISARRVR
jgi:hypothetical protein